MRGRAQMYDLTLIPKAWAATAPDAHGVDLQTVMYIIMGIVGGIVTGVGTLLYRKAPTPDKVDSPPISIEVLGPYQVIFDRLGAIQLTLERIAGGHVETREATAEALRTTRHDLKAVLHQMGQAEENDFADLKKLVHTELDEIRRLMHVQNTVSDRLDEFVRAKLK